ncbi:Reverse transcriptase domain [Trinorchestia longiramus]|nr:Reverse transcriptase domain [Trinorchestia longiramus]
MIFLPKPSTSQHEIKNYRPISLLDIHGKLRDKILTYRLTDHLTIHNIYNKRQHIIRHGRGTHTALATLHETLHIHLNQRHTIDVILRDVSKAFDKVWHTGLKYKLSQLNLHPVFTKILANFLSDRTAAIRIANYTGQPFPIKLLNV